MLQPASHMFRLILGAPIAVILALACLLTIGPAPEREDNRGSINRATDTAALARGKFGRLRRARR